MEKVKKKTNVQLKSTLCRPVDCIPTGIGIRCFCPDGIAGIELPGYCPDIVHKSACTKKHRRHKFKHSHRYFGRNGPAETSTALTATISMTIFAFMSRGHFQATFDELFVLGGLVVRMPG